MARELIPLYCFVVLVRFGVAVLALSCAACEAPILARDGTLVFQESGARGAAVLTANGVEFHDRRDVPKKVNVRDPSEPWRAPVGFILPSDGRLTKTSRPTILATTGLAITLRPSDTRVPSWGGEVLVRVDVAAPAAQGSARWGEDIAIVIDGRGDETTALVNVVLGQLSGRDRVMIVDSLGPRVVVPMMPASHRSLALAALDKHLSAPGATAHDLPRALDAARGALSINTLRRIVLLSERRTDTPLDPALAAALARIHDAHASFIAASTSPHGSPGAFSTIAGQAGGVWSADQSYDARAYAIKDAVPAAGNLAYGEVVVRFAGTPAPSHVLEASGGDVRWRLDAGELAIGDVRAGDARTEVVRVSVPSWQPGDKFTFTATVEANDAARAGERRRFSADIPCVYDDDIERIAKSRNGDVIAYASALATLKRLDAAFVGANVAGSGGLYRIARMQARSLFDLGRDMHDGSSMEQALILSALLDATAP
jgi:hypothetical protein